MKLNLQIFEIWLISPSDWIESPVAFHFISDPLTPAYLPPCRGESEVRHVGRVQLREASTS